MQEHFSWFMLIPGLGDGSVATFLSPEARHQLYVFPTACAVSLCVLLLAGVARLGLERARRGGGVQALVPSASFGVRNAMEIYVSAIWDLVHSNLGKKNARLFFPLIATLFLYILCSNLLGLIPGFLPPTDNMSNNLALALGVFLVFNVTGLFSQGWGYVKHLCGPIWWLVPLFLPIEVLGLCVRPISLSLRLAGNMFGDHTVFSIMSGLVPPVLPALFLGLGIFVSFIQALVFSLLSLVYIALAAGSGDEHH